MLRRLPLLRLPIVAHAGQAPGFVTATACAECHAGDKPAGEGMAHHQAQAVGLGLGTLLQRGDLFEVALEQYPEGRRLGLGTGLEGLGLQRVACRTGCPNAAKPRDVRERPSFRACSGLGPATGRDRVF